jgi:hypothetical protein
MPNYILGFDVDVVLLHQLGMLLHLFATCNVSVGS